ncbi:MAG: aminomethyltransferase [Clostridia bacterium]|uniref:Aminomethyltransferase n=1 Tax=Thermacetogenium phaeum TaxID=85874 RepID=A0A117LBP3_9THEO|nr:MAG: Aminomethyltransferase [Thermacetogenium phaeum]MDK2881088.1 aminomethyltransferase [Clostridia bacterium]MDN5365843.1 aminomethyltransferase [Thermacetogenium sp.]
MSLKRTPLYPMHQKHGGNMIDFGGWELPVEYKATGIIAEHHQVRQKAGLFDVSHMGEVDIRGEQAEAFVQELVTNDISALKENQVCYSPMCYPDGGCVDDLLIYKYDRNHYFLVINAANTDKDFAWMQEHKLPGVTLENVSETYAELALQGPLAEEVLQSICDTDLKEINYYWFRPAVKVAGIECIVSRTGYTGEDGFELFTAPDKACELWEAILEAGKGEVLPIGLGARDTLRFEAKMPLYGHELSREITPLEARLDRFVKLDKPTFIGKEALAGQKEKGPDRLLVELEMTGRGIPRAGYEIQKNGQKIGWVTSGGYAPTLDKNLGLALVKKEYAVPGEELDIIIRNKPVKARTGKGLFYKRTK